MTNYPKRLIEVDLPIARISAHARAEKDSRLGHIPRLHIYPAARPVAACRAVICAALWPDPVDIFEWIKGERHLERNLCGSPELFLSEAKKLMLERAKNHLSKVSKESYSRLISVRKKPELLNDLEELRNVLLDFIADFSMWENAKDQDYIAIAQALTSAAHISLGIVGERPIVVDPFAGGGAIPLESIRVGADAYASDLNPLSVLLNKVVIQYIPKYGRRLIEEVEEWTVWAQKKARKELKKYYPTDSDGSVPVVYLWARTILSEAPGQTKLPVEVPLLRSMRLSRGRSGGDWALRWVTKNGKIQCDEIQKTLSNGGIRTVLSPRLEIFKVDKNTRISNGTTKGGAVTCPITSYTTPVKQVRQKLAEYNGGTRNARLYCVVTAPKQGKGRGFRTPNQSDYEVLRKLEKSLYKKCKPDKVEIARLKEPLPADGTNGFRVQKYGMGKWGDLFTDRQRVALSTYVDLVHRYVEKKDWDDRDFKDAVQILLSLVVDRLADLNASLCIWQLNTPNTAHVFGRWVLPMVFDFGEVNPLAAAGGSPESAVKRLTACINDLILHTTAQGHVEQNDAANNVLPDNSAAAIITDPPYYDAIPYSDLLDFFAVWLNRTIPAKYSTMFENGLNPKNTECVVDKSKGKDRDFFQTAMTNSLIEARRVINTHGICIVVFAHKSTEGWEAQLESLINAGWVVTASWPIDTEMGSRLRAKGSAALASSIHLVCRPRSTDVEATDSDIGEWRDVLEELPKRIHEWMPRLADEGIVGADAIFSCLGPALEVYSRYSIVEKANGESVNLREYLEQVQVAVSNEALKVIFEESDAQVAEPEARLTAMWLWTIGTGSSASKNGKDEQGADKSRAPVRSAGFTIEYDTARKIAQGLGVHLEKISSVVEVKGEKARLLPVVERTRYLFGKDNELETGRRRRTKNVKQLSLFNELEEAEGVDAEELNTQGPTPGSTVLDRVHQAMILFGAGRGEALRRFLVQEGIGRDDRFWKLAQALSALYPPEIEEKRWVDGVLARKRGLGF